MHRAPARTKGQRCTDQITINCGSSRLPATTQVSVAPAIIKLQTLDAVVVDEQPLNRRFWMEEQGYCLNYMHTCLPDGTNIALQASKQSKQTMQTMRGWVVRHCLVSLSLQSGIAHQSPIIFIKASKCSVIRAPKCTAHQHEPRVKGVQTR